MTEHFFGADGEGTSPTGPLAAEVLRLMSSVQVWVQGWAEHNLGEANDGYTGSDCRWCPLCQFVAVLRGERPEVTEKAAEVGTAVAAAMHALVESAASADPPPRYPRPAPSPRVQKINLGDAG